MKVQEIRRGAFSIYHFLHFFASFIPFSYLNEKVEKIAMIFFQPVNMMCSVHLPVKINNTQGALEISGPEVFGPTVKVDLPLSVLITKRIII